MPDEVTIQFKLIEGDTEKDNRKPDGKTTRAFALDAETAVGKKTETISAPLPLPRTCQ